MEIHRVLAEPVPAAARQHMVRMRDGVRLATDVYPVPRADAPLPAVLVRLPYDLAATSCVALGMTALCDTIASPESAHHIKRTWPEPGEPTMPIEVDEARRLDEIADATISVARERGVSAVTVRAVAERLGGSTSVVTNYVPNRSALLINAVRRAQRDWDTDAGTELTALTGEERLRGYAQWMCTTTEMDEVMRRLLMEFLSKNPGTTPDVEEELRDVARDHRQELGTIVTEAGIPTPDLAADILHLMFRGYWLSSLEDPESWPSETGARVMLSIIDLLTKAS